MLARSERQDEHCHVRVDTDVKARVYGDAAVATGHASRSGT
jgi:hypothetical protein